MSDFEIKRAYRSQMSGGRVRHEDEDGNEVPLFHRITRMNTNDKQAPYGEKREPLLSDEELDKWQDNRKGGKGGIGFKWTAPKVRDFYENLIDKGELRVVKKVELWHPLVPEEEWKKWMTGSDAEFSMLVTKCCSRNPWCPPWGLGKGTWEDKEHEVKWPRILYVCPGCGGEIQK